jgi:hypothetical protein
MTLSARALLLAPLLAIALTAASAARAWHDEGHAYAAIAAVEALPDDVPAFFRDAAHHVAQGSIDPDVFKHRPLAQLDRAEAPSTTSTSSICKAIHCPPIATPFSNCSASSTPTPTPSARCPTRSPSGPNG